MAPGPVWGKVTAEGAAEPGWATPPPLHGWGLGTKISQGLLGTDGPSICACSVPSYSEELPMSLE